jgi:hypothetical protein
MVCALWLQIMGNRGVLVSPLAIVFMRATIRTMFGDIRPVDWIIIVIEVLVLALIAYEVVHDIAHRWKIRRRVKFVVGLIFEGVDLQQSLFKLQQSTTDGVVPADTIAAWTEAVNNWTQKTIDRLQRYSVQAGYSFAHIVSKPSSVYTGVPKGTSDIYGDLAWRINALRKIMENPDAYF